MLDFRKSDIIIQPKVHKYTLVFLPGWSRSARVDENVFKTVPFLKDTRIRILQSPHREFPIGSKSFHPSWWLSLETIPHSILPGLNETSHLINDILQDEFDLCPNLFLGGFSQGGATALYTGLITSRLPLLGILALSCFIAIPDFEKCRKNIPVFLYHGTKDEIVNLQSSHKDVDKLLSGINHVYIIEKDLGHTYSWKEFLELKKWMTNCLNYEKL